MGAEKFTFKKFSVDQRLSAMKVGTDGVLLGAWVSLSGTEEHILDVGSGTGLIALMVAQRSAKAYVDAVEIESGAAVEAKANFANSPWSKCLTLYQSDFQSFAHDRHNTISYDLIVSNPPYFNGTYKSQQAERTAARHSELLPFEDLIVGVLGLLNREHGRFAAIFPYENAAIFIAKAAMAGLYCNRLLEVFPKPGRSAKRMAAEFSMTKCELVSQSIAILDSSGNYTDQYRHLTSDFYLKF